MSASSTKLSVEFSPPKHGWIQLALKSGHQNLLIPVSHVPFDSLQELAVAVSAFLETGQQGVAHLNSEPEEYDVMFETGDRPSALLVKVVRYARGRRSSSPEVVLHHEADAVQTGRTVWRAFRKLETQFVSEHWAHAFPAKLVAALDRLTATAAGASCVTKLSSN